MKQNEQCMLVTHTSLKATIEEIWCFGSGCSVHIAGDGRYLKDLQICDTRKVTFGDGRKSKIVGEEPLISKGFLNLKMFTWWKDPGPI